MNDGELPLLSLGTSDFAVLRMRGQVYVDKTEHIHRLASRPGPFLFTRPRRFGKSLLISTFESLFKYGLRDFRGLAIEKLWRDEGHYRVVRLDFSTLKDFSTIEEFRTIFDEYFSNLMFLEGLDVPSGTAASGLQAFLEWLAREPAGSVVLLIDEYDAPLTVCLGRPEFECVRSILSGFFAQIRVCGRALRFLFITGIARFGREDLFSGWKSLADLTLSTTCGTLLGFTRSELEASFGAHLDLAARVRGISKAELVERLEEHYRGCGFSEDPGLRVWAPWPLLRFLRFPEDGFKPYWFESGGSPLRCLSRNPGDCFREKSLTASQLGTIASGSGLVNSLALLTQAGYLTIQGKRNGSFLLGYPNRDVADSMAGLYRNMLLAGRSIRELGAAGLWAVVIEGDADGLMSRLNKVFPAIAYPIGDETTLRNFAQLILTPGSDVRVFSIGRVGLGIETSRIRWVFEFKFLRKGDSAENRLDKALLQIREGRCGEEELGGRRLLRLAAVFLEEKRAFAAWKICPE